MGNSIFDDDDFLEFEPSELDVDINFNFKARFKIVDTNGYKLDLHKIYKRGISKKNQIILNGYIEEKFPLNINDASGVEIENFKVNKLYDGEFELTCYTDGSFDLYLGEISNE